MIHMSIINNRNLELENRQMFAIYTYIYILFIITHSSGDARTGTPKAYVMIIPDPPKNC